MEAAVEVEGEKRKPAAEKLAYDQHQGQGCFIPTKKAFRRQSWRHVPGSDDGDLTVDGL